MLDTPKNIAAAMIVALRDHKAQAFADSLATPTEEHMARLEFIIADMIDAGVEFTPELVGRMAVNSRPEVASHIHLPYWGVLNDTLDGIFNGVEL